MFQLIGLVLPPVIDLINGHIASSQWKFIVAFLFCAVIGYGLSGIEAGGWPTLDATVKSIFAVFGLSQITYVSVYQGSGIQSSIRGI